MGRIRILEDHLVNKIAAGEVVERPASVVKELVENAIDAGASRVEVRLRAGGRQLIEVTDDGQGMDADDALMCLERHGTSKIRREADLFQVASLGFRGEAIPSIASVSRLTIRTRPPDQEVGMRIQVEGGRLRKPEPVGCPAGTRITVRDLFYNLPVRRDFLRTVPTELGHCNAVVLREALIRPQVGFFLDHEGRSLIRAPAVADRGARAADLLKAGGGLIPVAFSSGPLEVEGHISPRGLHQGSARGAIHLFVNGRPVKDIALRRAINSAYEGLVPRGRYPVVVLEVRVPPEDVDVNIHPTKTEVRFLHDRDLQRVVAEGLREAVSRAADRPLPGSDRFGSRLLPREAPSLPLPGLSPQSPEHLAEPEPRRYGESAPATGPAASHPTSAPSASGNSSSAPCSSAPGPQRPRDSSELRLLGQLGPLLLCADGDDLVVVDLPRAHLALVESRIAAGVAVEGPQRLMVPAVVELPPPRAERLRARLAELAEQALIVEDYGGGAFALMALPPGAAGVEPQPLLERLAEGTPSRQALAEGLALAADASLSPYEQKELLRSLSAASIQPGHPALRRLTLDELRRLVSG